MPSIVLRWAWAVPLICEVIFSLIAAPAASSAALLIRRPDESFCMLFDRAYCVWVRLRWASIASTFVLTRSDIRGLLGLVKRRLPVTALTGLPGRQLPLQGGAGEFNQAQY